MNLVASYFFLAGLEILPIAPSAVGVVSRRRKKIGRLLWDFLRRRSVEHSLPDKKQTQSIDKSLSQIIVTFFNAFELSSASFDKRTQSDSREW